MKKIAILLTCFNRKEITKKCLESLFLFDIEFDVYLVDDGSTDGTSQEISKLYPAVTIIKGDGDLFWNRGMALAWKKASINDYDYYIWLNDDVILYENACDEIFECTKLKNNKAIISGVIENHARDRIIYGGFDANRKLVVPNGVMKEINRLNGNFVLVPKYVYLSLGGLDTIFHHDLGDVDYGLRAQKKGIKVWSTREAIASGETNRISRERLNNSTLSGRFKRLYSPLGSNPNIIFTFRKRHLGFFKAVAYYIFLIVLNIIPDSLNNLLFKQKYQ